MLSGERKLRQLKFGLKAQIFEGLGTSESGGLATAVTFEDSKEATAGFQPSHMNWVDESGRALRTTARRESDGGVLDGRKRWIGNTTFADLIVVCEMNTLIVGRGITGMGALV